MRWAADLRRLASRWLVPGLLGVAILGAFAIVAVTGHVLTEYLLTAVK